MLRRLATLLAPLFTLLLLGACASVKPPLAEGRLSPPAGQGIAIVALTASAAPHIRDTVQLQLHLQGEGKKYTGYSHLASDTIRAEGNTPNSEGRLLVLQLPAGRYQAERVSGSWQRQSNSWYDEREFFNLPLQRSFTLGAGEVVYLGQVQVNINLRPDLSLSQNTPRDFYDLHVRSGVTDTRNIQIRPLASQPAGQ